MLLRDTHKYNIYFRVVTALKNYFSTKTTDRILVNNIHNLIISMISSSIININISKMTDYKYIYFICCLLIVVVLICCLSINNEGVIMSSYRIKQMNWKVLDDDFDYTYYEQCDVYNISFGLTFDKRDKRYKASYCIDEYDNEGRKEFKTFDDATAWLQSILDKYVLDFLDEVITE